MSAYMDTSHYRVNKFVSVIRVMGLSDREGRIYVVNDIPLTLDDLEAVVRESADLRAYAELSRKLLKEAVRYIEMEMAPGDAKRSFLERADAALAPELRHQSGNNMNQATWPALREYIGAEIALSHARRDFSEAETDEDRRAHAERVGKLQEQSTRMETAFRESLP